jgi:segregation and condensation protein B
MGSKTPPKPSDKDHLGLQAFQQVPESAGLSLYQLSAALAGLLDAGNDPYGSPAATESPTTVDTNGSLPDAQETAGTVDDRCEITPRSILEAMLFVGSPQNEPLTSKQVASLMRGVRPAEIDGLVRELNELYRGRNCPYTIVAEGAGYRLSLRDEYARVRDRFYGKSRQARLSQAAIEVLSAVAYHAPITADEISRLRGKPSGSILAQLVRRQLLRLEPGESVPRRASYFTTPRFLELFGLESLDDLPRSSDLEEA